MGNNQPVFIKQLFVCRKARALLLHVPEDTATARSHQIYLRNNFLRADFTGNLGQFETPESSTTPKVETEQALIP